MNIMAFSIWQMLFSIAILRSKRQVLNNLTNEKNMLAFTSKGRFSLLLNLAKTAMACKWNEVWSF